MPSTNPFKNSAQKIKTLVIRKKKRTLSSHLHQNSSWKIAYADFVTAMMAFFLLMWLINTMSSEQKKGISNYFDPSGMSDAASGSGGILGGQTIKTDSVFQDTTLTPQAGPPLGSQGSVVEAIHHGSTAQQKISKEQEQQNFKEMQEEILEKLEKSPEFQEIKNNLIIDITQQGLHIQLIDQYKKPMFATASSLLYADALKLLKLVGKTIEPFPNKITITGHTDALRYSRKSGYTNWELSADRANAARRVLESIIGHGRTCEVIGKAATDPFMPNKPDDPSNRRISIVLLRQATTETPSDKAGSPSTEGTKMSPAPLIKKQAPSQGEPQSKPQGPQRLFQ